MTDDKIYYGFNNFNILSVEILENVDYFSTQKSLEKIKNNKTLCI